MAYHLPIIFCVPLKGVKKSEQLKLYERGQVKFDSMQAKAKRDEAVNSTDGKGGGIAGDSSAGGADEQYALLILHLVKWFGALWE